MKTRVPGCFCLLILLLAAVLYKNILPLCCLCALISADGLFAAWGKLCLKKLSGDIVVPESVELGCGYESHINISSRTICPYPHIALEIEIDNLLTGETEFCNISGNVPSRGSVSFNINITPECCGKIRVRSCKCRMLGILGLVALKGNVSFQGSTVILPETFPMEVVVGQEGASDPECDTFSPFKAGNDSSETFAIRDYIPGDSLKSIHWKLSGKFDRIVIRESSLPVDNNVLLLFEHLMPMGQDAPSSGVCHGLAEIAASLSWSLTENHVVHSIGFIRGDSGVFNIFEVESHEDFMLLLPELLYGGRSDSNGRDETDTTDTIRGYLEEMTENRFVNIVYISAFPSENITLLPGTCRATSVICSDNKDLITYGHSYVTNSQNYENDLAELVI